MDEIKANLKKTSAATMAILANFIQMNVNPMNPDSTKEPMKFKSKCFQVFGFDVVIDSSKKVWLLEVSDYPNMNIMNCKNGVGCICAKSGCPFSRTDYFVKSQVMTDAIKLVKATKTPLEEREEFRNLQRIFPSEDEDISHVHDLVTQLRELFLRTTNGKLLMTASDFERKMHAKPFISETVGLQKIDVRLLF